MQPLSRVGLALGAVISFLQLELRVRAERLRNFDATAAPLGLLQTEMLAFFQLPCPLCRGH